MFGRKTSNQQQPISKEDFFLNTGINSVEHAKAAGGLFTMTVRDKLAESGEAVSPELLIGLLAAAGGVAGIDTALRKWECIKDETDNPNLLLENTIGGHSYYIGDLPAYYLLENNCSVLCLAINAAIDQGAEITAALPEAALLHTANSVGTEAFGVPRLPAEHTPPASPFDLATLAWPQAVHIFDLTDLAAEQRPAAIGFALAKAIEMIGGAMDPLTMAKIAIEYAAPMAAVDPFRFEPFLLKKESSASPRAVNH